MRPTARGYKSWSTCDACGYQGVFVFDARAEENYADPGALGVMLDTRCPACEQEECVLVPVEQFQEMLATGEGSF